MSQPTEKSAAEKLEPSGASDRRFSADDALPEVKPPSGAFIVQLFVVPAVIVLAIISVTLLARFLVNRNTNLVIFVERIAQGKADSWQAAHTLAELISQDPALRVDVDLCTQLAQLLIDRMAAAIPPGGTGMRERMERESHFRLLQYLTIVQGEFNIDDGVPALLQAAQVTGEPEHEPIRMAAIDALAALLNNVPVDQQDHRQEMLNVLLDASQDDTYQMRERAVYALGLLDEPQANQRLAFLLADVYPNVRFNAAAGLCRHQNDADTNQKVVGVLVEMLSPTDQAAMQDETTVEEKEAKRGVVIYTGLAAGGDLAANNTDIDTAPLRKAAQGVIDAAEQGMLPSGVSTTLSLEAKQLLRELDEMMN